MRQLDLFGYIEEEKEKKEPKKNVPESRVNVVFVDIKEELPLEQNVQAEPSPDSQLAEDNKNAAPAGKSKSKRGRKSFKEIDAELVHVDVPDDETLFSKQYHPISDVAKWFHVNTSLIRYWENEFSILKPRKTRKGDRLFRPEDVKNIRLIYHLLRERKFSIEGAKKYLKENKSKADTQMQLMQTLTKFKSFLLEWKASLES